MPHAYDKRYLTSKLMALAVILVLMKYTEGIGLLVVLPLLLKAIFGRNDEDLLFYLTLTGVIVVANSTLLPRSGPFFVVQRAILALMALTMGFRLFGQGLHVILKPFLGLIVYLTYMAVTSALGWCPFVSYLKLFLYLGIFLAYLGTVNRILRNPNIQVRKVRSICLVFAILFVFGSMALIPFPMISQLDPEQYIDLLSKGAHVTSLFMGMTNQSQCLGPVVAALSCLLLGDMLFGVKRLNMLYVILLLCCPYLIYKTSSRTALGTWLIGSMTIVWPFFQARGITRLWRRRVVCIAGAVAILAVLLSLCSSGLRQGVMNFVMKWNSEDVALEEMTLESVYATRMGKIDEALYSFKKSPIIGNGFQVSADMQGLKPSLMVLSAPVEKGVWVYAVLEEGGVVGWLIFVIFLISATVMLIKRHAYIGASLFVTNVVANLGEFMFFSMSYAGGFMWAMTFLGLALDGARLSNERKADRYEGGYLCF